MIAFFNQTERPSRAGFYVITGLFCCVLILTSQCKSREDDEDSDSALATALLNAESGVTNNFNGTVTDILGNVWMKCAQGQSYESETDVCTGTGGGTTFDAQSMPFCDVENLCTDTDTLYANDGDAFDSCENLDFAGLTNWRLPDYTEIATVINGQSRDSWLVFFPQTPDDKNFWSRNEPGAGDSDAYSVNFSSSNMGNLETENKVTTNNYVRCVSPI